MKLCVIAGFFGSGETTLLIKLAQAALDKGTKYKKGEELSIIIIEYEIYNKLVWFHKNGIKSVL
jgi:G3E family GTPase